MKRHLLPFALSLSIFCVGCISGMAYRVPTDAMKPTITRQDMCVMNPLAYRSNEIERFDIVAFEMPETEKQRVNATGSVRHIKRIVGLPGEKIEIRDNRLLINDVIIDEPFEKIVGEKDRKRNYGPVSIPFGEYFLLGDNRPESMDSRYFEPSTIKKADIYSKVVEIKKDYYPKSTD